MMRQSFYSDEKGRNWATLLPDGVPDSEAAMGLLLGPPSMEPLGLPEEIEIRLHNQLFYRRLFTFEDVRRRRADVASALQSTLKVDAQAIVDIYTPKPEPVEEKPMEQPKRTILRTVRRNT